jgi:hypothetical protein
VKPRRIKLLIEDGTGSQYRVVQHTKFGVWRLEYRDSFLFPARKWKLREESEDGTGQDLVVEALRCCGFSPI